MLNVSLLMLTAHRESRPEPHPQPPWPRPPARPACWSSHPYGSVAPRTAPGWVPSGPGGLDPGRLQPGVLSGELVKEDSRGGKLGEALPWWLLCPSSAETHSILFICLSGSSLHPSPLCYVPQGSLSPASASAPGPPASAGSANREPRPEAWGGTRER